MVWVVRLIFVLLVAALSIRVEVGSIPEGAPHFRVAAENGDAFAQAQLGQHYLLNGTDDEGRELAIYWLERAASQDEGQAIYLLGVLREQGMYGAIAALPFYLKAARLNNAPAQERLAQLFASSELGRPNYTESYKWYLLVTRHGGDFGLDDFGAGRHLSPAQKAMAQQAANFIAAAFTGRDVPAS